MGKRELYALLFAALFTGTALADQLPIEGTYGDADGCAYVADQTNLSDGRIVVTAQSIEFHESGCTFLQVLTGSFGRSVVTALCGGEGEDWVSTYLVVPDDDDPAALQFKMQGGDEFRFTVRKCE